MPTTLKPGTDGKIIRGVTEEREKAFEIYDKAIEAGNASYLLDQEADDILNISVGNIIPQQEVNIRLSYISELPVVDGIIRLQIPSTVSPRYAPADADPLKADRINPPHQMEVPYRLNLSVRVLADTVGTIESPSHGIKMRSEQGYTIVSLADDTIRLDRDFILQLETKGQQSPFCLVGTHENGDQAALFRFYPTFEELPQEPDAMAEVLFVLDCSGSMSGSSIAEAKQATELSLRSLSEGDFFNIIRFGSTYELYAKEPVAYNGAALKKAIGFVRSIDADLGGTALCEPMRFVCSLPASTGSVRDVLLLTDGEVSNPDEVINMVNAASDKMRVFSFGIGYGASHHLVKGVARAGGGASEMIQPGEKIQPKVLRQFSRMSQPFLTDVCVEFSGATAQLPRRLPPLFEGDSYTLYAKISHAEPQAEAVFKGTYLEKSYSWSARILDVGKDDAIPSLWALAHIKHLKETGVGGSNQADRKRGRVENEIRDLGLRFNLLTDYTSIVAVETRAADDKTQGQPEYRRIPVMLTKDWHGVESAAFDQMQSSMMSIASPAAAPDTPMYSRKLFGGLGSGMSSLLGGAGAMAKKITRSKKSKMAESREVDDLDSSFGQMELYAEEEWHLVLLGTQEAEGYFTGLLAISDRLGIEIGKLNKLAATLGLADAALGDKVLATWLAIKLLSGDAEALQVSRRAIRKAERWLNSNTPADGLKAGGVPLSERLKSEHGVSV